MIDLDRRGSCAGRCRNVPERVVGKRTDVVGKCVGAGKEEAEQSFPAAPLGSGTSPAHSKA